MPCPGKAGPTYPAWPSVLSGGLFFHPRAKVGLVVILSIFSYVLKLCFFHPREATILHNLLNLVFKTLNADESKNTGAGSVRTLTCNVPYLHWRRSTYELFCVCTRA